MIANSVGNCYTQPLGEGSVTASASMSWEHWPHLGLFLVLLATGMGLPVPEDVPLLTAGYLCHIQHGNVYFMVLVAMVGILGSDLILFTIGRRWGHHVVEHRFARRLVNPARLLMAERMFKRHGMKIVFAGRFLPGLRPMIFMATGVLKVRYYAFLLADGMAALISVPTLIILGKLAGENVQAIAGEMRQITHAIVMVIAVATILVAVFYWHWRQKRIVARAGINPDIDMKTFADLPPGVEPPGSEQPARNGKTKT